MRVTALVAAAAFVSWLWVPRPSHDIADDVDEGLTRSPGRPAPTPRLPAPTPRPGTRALPAPPTQDRSIPGSAPPDPDAEEALLLSQGLDDLRNALAAARRCEVLADMSIAEIEQVLDDAEVALSEGREVSRHAQFVEAYYSALLDAFKPHEACVNAELEAGSTTGPGE